MSNLRIVRIVIVKGGNRMKIHTVGRVLVTPVMSAVLALSCVSSFAQQPTTGGSAPGMSRAPGSEGAAGTAGASATPPGTTASPAPDAGASASAPMHHKKHKKSHHHRRHASGAQAASATKP